MPSIHPQVGQVGLPIRVVVIDQDGDFSDLAWATTYKILLRPPGGTVLERTATLSADSDSTGGVRCTLEYYTTADDLTVPGRWKVQGYVAGTLSSIPREWPGQVGEFYVERNVGGTLAGPPSA